MRWVARDELRSLEFPPADAELIARLLRSGVEERRSRLPAARRRRTRSTTAVARRDEVAMDVAERDRTRQRRRPRRARHAPDLALARTDAIAPAPERRAPASNVRPTSRLRHAPVAAMQDADDHFLADVAALRQADRAILDARLERNRVRRPCRRRTRDARSRCARPRQSSSSTSTAPAAGSADDSAAACRGRRRSGRTRHPGVVAAHDDRRGSASNAQAALSMTRSAVERATCRRRAASARATTAAARPVNAELRATLSRRSTCTSSLKMNRSRCSRIAAVDLARRRRAGRRRRARARACRRSSGPARSASPRSSRVPASAPRCRWSAGPADTTADRCRSAGAGRGRLRSTRPAPPCSARYGSGENMSARAVILFRCALSALSPPLAACRRAGRGAPPAAPTPQPAPAGAGAWRRRVRVFSAAPRSGASRSSWRAPARGWIITSTGRIGDLDSLNRFEMKYAADWQPLELRFEGARHEGPAGRSLLTTSFGMTTAINEITQDGTTISKTDQISAPDDRAAEQRLRRATRRSPRAWRRLQPGAEIPIYVAPQARGQAPRSTPISRRRRSQAPARHRHDAASSS